MRICLILEGSYPYTHGGVSSWMHNYIQQMPDTEFVLWVIGAHHKDQGKFFVQPRENVVEIHEVFLDDALKVRIEQDRRYQFEQEEIAALKALMDCGHPDWRVLCALYQTKQVKPGAFLMSEAFLDILTELCEEQYPYIKGRIQMIICPADLYDIPGMTIFDPFLRVIATDGNDVPDAQCIQKHLYRFCNSLTDTDPLSQWSDDLMRIRFFQFVIPDILTDKIMYIFLFFQLGHRFCRTHQLLYTGCH